MADKPLSRDEIIQAAKTDRKVYEEETSRRETAKVLRQLAPALGLSKRFVSRVWDSSDGNLLDAARADGEEGYLIPPGLIIGGYKGLSFSGILSKDVTKTVWFKKFLHHVEAYREVIWVLPIKGSGRWVIHNTDVNPNKRRHCVHIPAHVKGLNHIQVIRLELFVEEKAYE